MLAEAVANHGEFDEDLKNQLEMDNKAVEMTDKQRIRCLLMVQLFFAGLGDDKAIQLKDQISIANRVKNDYAAKMKAQQKAEALKRKEERAEKKRQRRIALGSDYSSEDSEKLKENESDAGSGGSKSGKDEDDSQYSSGQSTDTEKERKRAKKLERKRQMDEQLKINTDTQV